MKIAVDTNFLISATQWDYSVSHKLFEKLIRDNVEMFTTKEILEEFVEVLRRDFLYSDEESKILIELILKFLLVRLCSFSAVAIALFQSWACS